MDLFIFKPINRRIVFILGLIIPILFDSIFSHIAYRDGNQPKSWVIGIALATGLIIITQYKGKTRMETSIVVISFILLLLLVLFFTSMYVSCLNGDCL